MLELGVAVATGTRWLGIPCAERKVLLVNFEVDRPDYWQRIRATATALSRFTWAGDGFVDKVRENLSFVTYRGVTVPGEGGEPGAPGTSEYATRVIEAAEAVGAGLVVLDPWRSFAASVKSENDASEVMRAYIQVQRIASETGAAVVFVHHYGKAPAGTRDAIDRASGSGAFASAPDLIVDMAPLANPEDPEDRSHSRVGFVCRNFREPPDIDVRFDWPVHAIDTGTRNWSVRGAYPAGERSEARKQAKGREHEAVNEAIAAAVAELEAKGEDATAKTVWDAVDFSRTGKPKPGIVAFKGYLRPASCDWCEWENAYVRPNVYVLRRRAEGPAGDEDGEFDDELGCE